LTVRSRQPNLFRRVGSDVAGERVVQPTNVSGDIVYARACRGLPFIEDVDRPPLEVVAKSDYDKLAVG
jgi:hypothetical protein